MKRGAGQAPCAPLQEPLERIVERAKAGEDDAALQLLQQFRPLQITWFRNAIGFLPQEEHSILQSQVVYEFLRLVSEFEPARGVSFLSYVSLMMEYRMLNFLRAEQKRLACIRVPAGVPDDYSCVETAPHLPLRSAPCPDECSNVVLRVWWKQALDCLSLPQRKVIEMIANGYSEREIAAKMRVSNVAVHKLKQRAQNKLQRIW